MRVLLLELNRLPFGSYRFRCVDRQRFAEELRQAARQGEVLSCIRSAAASVILGQILGQEVPIALDQPDVSEHDKIFVLNPKRAHSIAPEDYLFGICEPVEEAS